MDLDEAIAARRSVRSYRQNTSLDSALIEQLIHAAVHAPSAMNAQAWVFAVVQSAPTLKRWSDRAKAMLLERVAKDSKAARHADQLRDPSFNVFYDASTLIVIGVHEPGTYTDADCWLAAENLMLAATGAGLATCPIGFALPVLNTRDVKEEIRIAPGGVAVAAILLGYPRGEVSPVPRGEPRVSAWIR
jgi:nitroreductase